ncbi:ribonuclease Z [Aneurinibacillus thermoaerophilus]|uniref:ribonuclease Z n=2 Tax=Aneurinibacillus group TaxID=85151 RepID=UPI000B0A4914|nr:ribonuclease Z [Aneurinibacillus thermoaerophilus]MED0677740.1 ribonuclease Z [Aneurinibacillus thermoaerophilus]MED0762816.1 ribonuclease Z [Aneurinibacillus thermoaerophilus]
MNETMLDIALLGCGGTMPLPKRWLTALLASYQGKMILIDCGEGTQVTMKMLGWGFKSIEAICFTHYHADHVTGLPGLLFAIANAGRTDPLLIIGPPGLTEVVRGMTVIAPYLPYELQTIELSAQEPTVSKIVGVTVRTLPVEHTVPCLGYTLEIERGRKFNPVRASELEIPVPFWGHLQKGEEVTYNGRTFTPDMVLGPPRKGLKVAYCTDTRPTEELVEFIRGADLFIGEGMYGDPESLPKAEEHKHMLFEEAAMLALRGGVKELWLTHYSPSLSEPEQFIDVARRIFPQTKLGEDRMTISLVFEKD